MKQYVMYKPKPDKSGIAVNFQASEDGLFVTLGKQKKSDGENDVFDWKDENGKARNAIKFGLPDIGAFLALFNKQVPEIKLYHEFEKAGKKIVTNISAAPYSSKNKEGNLVARGYSVNILRDGQKFGFGISFAEAQILTLLFNHAVLSFLEYRKKE